MESNASRKGSLSKVDFGVPEMIDFPEHLKLVNQTTTEENVAVFKAAAAGNLKGVRDALANGGKPNFFYHPQDQKNALHIASENGFTDIVSVLLENGAVVDCLAASTQSTPLLLASSGGHVGVINALLRAGADVDNPNCYGNTAMHEACRLGSEDVVEILLHHGASVTRANKKGSTPLHFLCYGENARAHSLSFVRKLIDAGATVDARDNRGVTPLLVCCTSGRLDIIRLLIERGADPTIRDDAKQDAYATALFYKQYDVAEFFNPDSPFQRFGGAAPGLSMTASGKESTGRALDKESYKSEK